MDPITWTDSKKLISPGICHSRHTNKRPSHWTASYWWL